MYQPQNVYCFKGACWGEAGEGVELHDVEDRLAGVRVCGGSDRSYGPDRSVKMSIFFLC